MTMPPASDSPPTRLRFRPLWLLLGLLIGATPLAAQERLLVFAAASLKNALDAVAANWEAETGQPVALSYAGSSALARQLQRGAPADLFISANLSWMEVLDQEGLLQAGTRRNLLSNQLVLIGSGASEPLALEDPQALPARLGEERLAMALVDSVPAGIYGKAALQSLGLWESVKRQVVQSDNVRSALALVARGEAPLGVVYQTDTRAEPRVSVLATFPADTHPPIVYPVAQLAESTTAGAADFLAFLSSSAAQALFEAQGFTVLPPPMQPEIK